MYNESPKIARLKNGLSIAYKEEFDTSKITDELIDGIFNVNFHVQIRDDNDYTDNNIYESLGTYPNILKTLLKSSDKNTKKEIFSNMQSHIFVENIRYIYELYKGNIDLNTVNEIFKNNKFLYTNNITNISKNYSFLREKQYVHMEDLDKFYMENSTDNMSKKIDTYLLNKMRIPKKIELLSVDPTDKNQDMLDKNLKLIVKQKGLIDYNDFEKNKATVLFNHTLLENLEILDKKEINRDLSFINNSKHSDKFIGIKGFLNTTLDKINPTIISNLNLLSNTKEYEEFLDSFNTIKKWDSYDDEIKRLTDLKDEFITRIIFGTLKNTVDELLIEKSDIVERNFYDGLTKSNYIEYNSRNLTAKDLITATGKNMTEFFTADKYKKPREDKKSQSNYLNNILSKMISVYPQSANFVLYDTKKINPKLSADEIILSKIRGDILNRDVPQVVINRIEKNTYKLIDEIWDNKNSNNKPLFKKLFKSINYYMIKNNELEIQNYYSVLKEQDNTLNFDYITYNKRIEELEKVSKKMLKSKSGYTFEDKLIYYLYNSNRTAHSNDVFGLKKHYEDNFVMNPNIEAEMAKKNYLLQKYSFLNRYGIDIDFINPTIDTYSNINNKIITIYNVIDQYTSSDNKGKNFEFLSESGKSLTINYLKNKLNYKKLDNYQEINESSILNIIGALDELRDNPNNDLNLVEPNKKMRSEIEKNAKERNVEFAAKIVLIDKIVDITEKKINKPLEKATQYDKKILFDKDGYIVEYQKTSDTSIYPVLVCYDRKFEYPIFSVHIVDNDVELDEDTLKNEASLKHFQNAIGLVSRIGQQNYDIKYDTNLLSGFVNLTKEQQKKIDKSIISDEVTVATQMKYDYVYHKGDKTKSKDLIKQYKYYVKEEKNILKNSNLLYKKSKSKKEDENAKTTGQAALEVLNNSMDCLLHDIVNHKDTIIYDDVQRSLFGEVYNVKIAGKNLNISKEKITTLIDENNKYYEKFHPNNNQDNKTK